MKKEMKIEVESITQSNFDSRIYNNKIFYVYEYNIKHE